MNGAKMFELPKAQSVFAVGQPELLPEQRLAHAVIVQAYRDYVGEASFATNDNQPRLQMSAKLFLATPEFDFWCDLLGVDPATVRRWIASARGGA
jgi:hypothetical protein